MDTINYKSYQQVLNLPGKFGSRAKKDSQPHRTKTDKVSKTKVTKPRKDTPPVKRRTKTGCLTCRRRKKKCDEDKVNGKCQACTRNFLECCWPEPAEVAESKLLTPAVSPILSPVESPSTPDTSYKSIPYKSTPISDVSAKCSIHALLASPETEYPSPAHSPAPEKRDYTESKISDLHLDKGTKFIITTFDSQKDLCQVE